jgi:glycosyltransferase involved in cell wall biosynthesis
MKILISTDAWYPQVNGVVKTIQFTKECLERCGHEVIIANPTGRICFRMPFTKDVRSPLWVSASSLMASVEWADCVHISTEGLIGLATRRACCRLGFGFTTAYHTDIPEFLLKNLGFGARAAIAYLKWFHSKSSCLMATTQGNVTELKNKGFSSPIKIWSRGVDTDLFRPRPRPRSGSGRIRLVYCGRISPEKGIADFLELDNRYDKTVIGDGVELPMMRLQHPNVRFTGFLHGRQLADELASHDIFVFPSKFDTFGLVVIEAMSCGLPVACYDVRGPGEIVRDAQRAGCANDDLAQAVKSCIDLIGGNSARSHVLQHYTWESATAQFLSNLVPKKP